MMKFPFAFDAAGDPETTMVLRARYGVRYRWLLLLAVMVGTMASIMSSTIVNVAIPGMSQQFALGQERAQWVTSGFMVAMTVSMLTTPWLLARYGYRHTYVGCMVLLMAGGVVGGFARTFAGAGRARGRGAGRGRGAADSRHHHPARLRAHEQGRASGIFGMGVVLAPAIGPSIGGCWWTGSAGARSSSWWCRSAWRRLWLALRFVPVTGARRRGGQPRRRALDWLGLLLAAASARCACSTAWWSCAAARPGGRAAAGAGGAVALLAFIAWQRPALRARGREPLMNLRCSHRAVRHGQRRGLHLRHRAVRLHLPAAGVHADGAEAVGRPRGHHPAALGPGAGGDHRHRRPPGRPPAHQPAGEHRAGAAGAVVRG
jgi:hypothetical protein